jgi:drug/metabolite transporter (DMT)-like permease
MGVFNILSAITFWTALTLDDVSHVAPIVYVFPAMVALGASAIFHEQLTGSTWAAIGLGIAGAALLFQAGISHPQSVLAAGLALVSAATAAMFYIVAGRVIREDDWLPATATVFTSAAIVYVPIVAIAGWQPPDGKGWGLVVAIAVAGTVAPFMLFFAGITRIGATHAAILSVAEPVVTVSLALAVLGERLSAVQAIGIVLVLVSFLAAGARRRENVEPN